MGEAGRAAAPHEGEAHPARGVRELVGLNRPVSEIPGCRITDMEVMLPHENERELLGNWKVR